MPVTVTKDRTAAIASAIQELARTRVLVGIPADATPRKDEGVTNAMLGYYHEFGTQTIPARPFLVPGVQNAQHKIVAGLQNAGKAALDGNSARAEQILNAVGMAARNSVVERISSNIPPPLAESTIRNRRRRSKGSTYRRKATAMADVVALIDTGQLRASVTSVLRKL